MLTVWMFYSLGDALEKRVKDKVSLDTLFDGLLCIKKCKARHVDRSLRVWNEILWIQYQPGLSKKTYSQNNATYFDKGELELSMYNIGYAHNIYAYNSMWGEGERGANETKRGLLKDVNFYLCVLLL